MAELDMVVAALEDMAAKSESGVLTEKPNVDDVKAALGEKVTADERDAAWAVYSKPVEGSGDSDSEDGKDPDIELTPAEILANAQNAAAAAKKTVAEGIAKQKEEQRLAALEKSEKLAADRDAQAETAKAEREKLAKDKADKAAQYAIDSVKGHPVVTNNHDTALNIAGVVIKPSQSASVGNFNKHQSLMKSWIASGVISVEYAD